MVAVPSKRLGLLGLFFGFLGMLALILYIMFSELSAGDIAFLVSLQALPLLSLLCTELQYNNNRAVERANAPQHPGNVDHADSLVYVQMIV